MVTLRVTARHVSCVWEGRHTTSQHQTAAMSLMTTAAGHATAADACVCAAPSKPDRARRDAGSRSCRPDHGSSYRKYHVQYHVQITFVLCFVFQQWILFWTLWHNSFSGLFISVKSCRAPVLKFSAPALQICNFSLFRSCQLNKKNISLTALCLSFCCIVSMVGNVMVWNNFANGRLWEGNYFSSGSRSKLSEEATSIDAKNSVNKHKTGKKSGI